MTTRSIVPRADGEGSIGTELKKWGTLNAKNIAVDAGNIKTATAETLTVGTLNNMPISDGTINGVSFIATPRLYKPDVHFYAGSRTTILSPNILKVNINNAEYINTQQKTLDITTIATWDNENLIVAANRTGKDFYIYACIPATGAVPDFVLSANSTVPNGYTVDDSRKVGGFHCLCTDVGTIAGHTLSGYTAGDILPASVWDLSHRPKSDPEGMAYIDGIDLWVDIYLASWTGSYNNNPEDLKLVSKFGGVCADGTSTEKFHCYKFDQIFGRQNKRLLHQNEFVCASIGSNQGTNVLGSADVNTTGGFRDTTGRRMISDFGIEDCCGNLWQWGLDFGTCEYSGDWIDAFDGNDKYVAGKSLVNPHRALFGGSAADGAYCGSRASAWYYGALDLAWNVGARGASEPLRGEA